MLMLGIDTSCDDTSASVLRDGREMLSNVISSQAEIHRIYGGIVPELASRRHSENIIPVIKHAVSEANTDINDIDAFSICYGPGLIGSLLVGCCFVKALAYTLKKKVYTVNHLEGHLYSIFLADRTPPFPFLSLVVSGGHTNIFLLRGHGVYEELGKTRDDAAGEAYDKVAKIIGLSYPGGPQIDRLAERGNQRAYDFPRAYLPGSLDFSFSGLKTSIRNMVSRKYGDTELTDEDRADIAASFQDAVVDVLIRKIDWAVAMTGVKRVSITGGVAANSGLRRRFIEFAIHNGLDAFMPPLGLCTDNGAMIAAAGYQKYLRGEMAGLDFNPRAYLPVCSKNTV